MKCAFFSTIAVCILHFASCKTKWIHNELSDCFYNFKQSPRELFRNNQVDPLIIWLGSPSTALQVAGKHGKLPIPTVWSSYANVLYVHCSEAASSVDKYSLQIVQFMQSWCFDKKFANYCDRPLFIAGNHLDRHGGSYVLEVGYALVKSHVCNACEATFNVAGIAAGFLPWRPAAVYVAHRSFESANKLNFWTMDRARQPVQCNALHSQVEFWMHDVKLHYCLDRSDASSGALASSSGETFEYKLCSVATPDSCYHDLTAFEQEFNARPAIPHEVLHPTLETPASASSHTSSLRPFPRCDCPTDTERGSHHKALIASLLHLNVSVLLYDTIRKSSIAMCSFYIGIFNSDGLRLLNDESEESPESESFTLAVDRFNAASLDEMSSAWFPAAASSSTIPGRVQDGSKQEDTSSSSAGRASVVWMQFDASDSAGQTSLSKGAALDILAHLLGPTNEVDSVELLVMDQLTTSIN